MTKVSIPLWFDYNKMKKIIIHTIYILSQFHYGSITTLLITKFLLPRVRNSSQFHYGSITTRMVIKVLVISNRVSIPLWFDYNSIKRVDGEAEVKSLNSTMVRLQPISRWFNVIFLFFSLNSTMVRLQPRSSADGNTNEIVMSQFHYGSITTESIEDIASQLRAYSLNSTMVRLQRSGKSLS